MRAASREFGRKITYVSSFGAESAAMLGLIAEVDPGLPVVFIDTGMHFRRRCSIATHCATVLS